MRSRSTVLRRFSVAVLAVALLASMATPAGAGELWESEPLYRRADVKSAGEEAGSVSDLAADDARPGVPIADASDYPDSVVNGTLNAASDVHDYYSFYAAPGEKVFLYSSADSASTLDVVMTLYRRSGSSWVAVRSSFSSGDTDWITYTVPEGYAPGTWCVDVQAVAGSGSYELWWAVNSRSDGNFPGLPIPDSPIDDTVSQVEDPLDIYAVNVGVNEGLSLTLTTADATDQIKIVVFGPGSVDAWTAAPVVSSVTGSSLNMTLPARTAGEQGVYYVAVYAANDEFADYRLTWNTLVASGVNMPGLALPAGSPFTTSLGASPDRVYSVDLEYGQRIDVDLKVVSGGATMSLYGPSAVDVSNAPVASGDPVSYWVSAAQAGRHYLRIHPTVAGSSVMVTYSITDGVEREDGADRYVTSAMVSKADFPKGSNVVVVATGADFPDALSASSLAGAFDAPVLLTKPGTLPSAVRSEIARLGAKRCFVVGGVVAVSADVVTAIDAIPGMTTPVRLAGSDRYSTATAVAEATLIRQGALGVPVALLARGDDFADALALAPIGWASTYPILLTKPGALPSSTASLLTVRNIEAVMIAGGEAAVSTDVEDAINGIIGGGGDPTIRKYGTNRYETASVIADWSTAGPWLDWSYVGLATGTNFPDALGGGAGAAKKGGVLLLTRPTELTGYASSAISSNEMEIDAVQLLGGTAALTNTVESAVGNLIQ